jgi:hypothetical protein
MASKIPVTIIRGGMMLAPDEIASNFTYHPPKDKMHEIFSIIRSMAKELALKIDDEVPDGREKSLALTKLEEAVFWANAGISRHG